MHRIVTTNHPFTQFLIDQADQRKLSARKFAAFAGINHEVITRFMNNAPSDEVGYPSLSTLRKLSDATNVSLLTLIALAFPGGTNLDINTNIRLLAEQIAQLSPADRVLVEGFIRDALAKRAQK